jgi:hypothetical protein
MPGQGDGDLDLPPRRLEAEGPVHWNCETRPEMTWTRVIISWCGTTCPEHSVAFVIQVRRKESTIHSDPQSMSALITLLTLVYSVHFPHDSPEDPR